MSWWRSAGRLLCVLLAAAFVAGVFVEPGWEAPADAQAIQQGSEEVQCKRAGGEWITAINPPHVTRPECSRSGSQRENCEDLYDGRWDPGYTEGEGGFCYLPDDDQLCAWDLLYDMDDFPGNGRAVLDCPASLDADTLLPGQRPPIPDGCRQVEDSVGRPTGDVSCPAWVALGCSWQEEQFQSTIDLLPYDGARLYCESDEVDLDGGFIPPNWPAYPPLPDGCRFHLKRGSADAELIDTREVVCDGGTEDVDSVFGEPRDNDLQPGSVSGEPVEGNCKFRPPYGHYTKEWGDGPAGAGGAAVGHLRDNLIRLGIWQPSEQVTFPPGVVEKYPWFVEELSEQGECYLNHRWPEDECPDDGRPKTESTGFSILPDQCWGTFPSSVYDVGYEPGNLTDFEAKLWGWPTNLAFNIGKKAIQVSFGIIGFALDDFDLMMFSGFSEAIADAYNSQIVGEFELKHIAWLTLMGFVAFALVTGRFNQAGGEFLMTVLMVTLAALLLSNLTGYMGGVADTIDGVSTQVLIAAAVANDDERDASDQDSASQAMWAMQARFHELFVEEPYDQLNWGRKLSGECAELRNRILSTGPHGGAAWPRDYMAQVNYEGEDVPDCTEEAAFMGKESNRMDRLAGAAANGTAAVLLALVLTLIAFSVILGKFLIAVMFGVVTIAAACAIFPGAARKLAWSWVATVAQAMIAVIGMSLVLSLLLVAVEQVLTVPEGTDWELWQRWLLIAGVIVALMLVRKKVLASAQSGAQNMTDRLSGLASGSGASFAGAGSGGGRGGAGSSLLGATRQGDFAKALTAGSTAMTAGIGMGRIGMGAARMYAAPVVGPVRGGMRFAQKRLEGRRAANRVLDNNVALDALVGRRGRMAGGGGGGGGARGGGGEGGGQPLYKRLMQPRHQRRFERGLARQEAVERFRQRNPRRRFWHGAYEPMIGRARQAQTALVGEHSLLSNRGRAARSDRERYPDVPVRDSTRAAKQVSRRLPDAALRDPEFWLQRPGGPSSGGSPGGTSGPRPRPSITVPPERRPRTDFAGRGRDVSPPWTGSRGGDPPDGGARPGGGPSAPGPRPGGSSPRPPADPDDLGRSFANRASGVQDRVDRSAQRIGDQTAGSAASASDYAARQARRTTDAADRLRRRASGAQDKADRDAQRLGEGFFERRRKER